MKKLKKLVKEILKIGVAFAVLMIVIVKMGQLISWVLSNNIIYFIGLAILVVLVIVAFKECMDW